MDPEQLVTTQEGRDGSNNANAPTLELDFRKFPLVLVNACCHLTFWHLETPQYWVDPQEGAH